MTFLSLAAWQALALGAAVAGAVTWLFFLKLRHPRVSVPSLLLWRRAMDAERPQAIVERLRRWISLAIALAVGLLLALAPARPATGARGGQAAPLLVVVDTAPGMAARTADGRTRLAHARDRAREAILAAAPGVPVALADTSGAVLAPAGAPRTDVLAALDRLAAAPADRRAAPAAPAGGRVVFVTDGVAPDPCPESAERVSVFEPADDVGIAAFGVRAERDGSRNWAAYLRVANRSARAVRATITMGDAAATWETRTVDLAAGADWVEVRNVPPSATGPVHASVKAEGDAFPADDTAWAWVPSRDPLKVVLVTDGNRPLETLLALDGGLSVTTVSPARFEPRPGTDVYVFDRFAPDAAPGAPALLFHPTPAPWLAAVVGVGADGAPAGPVEWRPHPVAAHVASSDIRVDRTAALVIPAGAASDVAAVATAGGAPLVVAASGPVRCVVVGFDLRASDFPYQVGFPLFVQNALAWLGRPRPAIAAEAGVVRVPWAGAVVETASGEPVASRQVLGDTVFDAPGPGVYLARRGGERQPIVVGPAGAGAVDINRSALGRASAAPSGAPRGRELWTIMLAVALVLVAGEWWTFHRRLTL